MTTNTLLEVLSSSVSARHLLGHPYYKAWQDGFLSEGDLASYAEQYRHFERCLPEALGTILESLPDSTARDWVEDNLNDEQTRPRPHVEIFEEFANSVGSRSHVGPSDATLSLVGLYTETASTDPVAALSVIAAYELQASEIAASKARSLQLHYGLSGQATEFWNVHAELEKAHGQWTVNALVALDCDPSNVERFARASAETWWAFLDEREVARVS